MEEQALVKFDYGEKPVRTWIDPQFQPWFCGTDVATILELKHIRETLRQIKPEWKHSVRIADAIGRMRKTAFVNEPALYKLVFRSRKPEAEKFTDWIAVEVLPTIRKTGTFPAPPNSPLEALRVAVDQMIVIEEKQRQLTGKVEGHDKRPEQIERRQTRLDNPKVEREPVTPTQIGAYFDPPLSARRINRLLHEREMQWKVGGQWVATEKGKPFSVTIAKEIRPQFVVHQLLWERRTIELIR